MRAFFSFVMAGLMATTMMAGVVTYTPDDTSVFPNPERGFTEELGGETMLSNTNNHVVQSEADWFFDPEDENYGDRQNQTLVMLMYYLGNYKTKDLSTQILQGFDEDMQILRQHGFKCVLRFAYDWNSKNDASLTYVKKHIASLKPHLASNADVIYVLETGFVGQWGEWYYSSNFVNETQHLNENRRQVLTAMLDACPSNRFLLARYAMIKTEYLGDTQALGAEEAFTGTIRARLGHHNDAFLNSYGNDGTYDDGTGHYTAMRNLIAQETLYVPNGGETNVESSSLAKTVAKRDTTIAELRRFHWSFCGSQYSESVTNKWRANGTFEEMNRLLGYRLQLLTATLPDAATAGETMQLSLQIRNTGCAPLYNERPAYIVLKNNNYTCSLPLASDPRRWAPNNAVTTVSESLTIPSDVPSGTYELDLYLPDASPSIAADPRYAVRLANVGTWDAATGMNSLQASLSVTNQGGQGLTTNEALTGPTTNDRLCPATTNKLLRNGQLLIQVGENIYTSQGYLIKY